VLNVQLCIPHRLVVGMNRNEVGRLWELINNHSDGIILVGSERQTHDEIHADVFPLPGRNIQKMQKFDRSQVICLDPLTGIAFCHIASSLALHPSAPELRLQVMIYFGATMVDGIFGCMSSSKIFFCSPSSCGMTIQSLNQSILLPSTWKQLTLGSPLVNLLLMWDTPTSCY
jgi:hypothetical protein